MAPVSYGRASLCFPLALSSEAWAAALVAETQASAEADVSGFTPQKTREAGACTVRLELRPGSPELAPGAHLVLIRAAGCDGWLPGLAGTRKPEDNQPPGLEVVVFGRPDKRRQSVMYLPDLTLQALFSTPSACVRPVQLLMPVQHDCPGQWLRDRLLRLADAVETEYSKLASSGCDVLTALRQGGIEITGEAEDECVAPSDMGDRISQEELGYWTEEMKTGHRCAGSMDGQGRQDVKDLASMGLDGQ